MSFEIKEKDVLARIGKLKTKSGTMETPLLLPVINPVIQPIPPKNMIEEFGFEAVITNAHILKQHFRNRPIEKGLHKFLSFAGPIMTDSGAYQILVYNDVQIEPGEIVGYQEQIDTDIATILDLPTGWKVTEAYAKQTTKETLERAKRLFRQKTRDDILWVGPVQGGGYLNLVAKSAKDMGKLPFQIHALGSPTEVLESYRFDVLVDMIMTAKMNLPVERPFHLFGAGHPFMFALAVALGCDLFDSAAYAIYAREDRYMTENGTWRLRELDYFPCACPKCAKMTPKQALELPEKERTGFLAEHNLLVCAAEVRRIRQAIKDGRMWEHLEAQAHAHPELLQAVKKIAKYKEHIEKHAPVTKDSGLFFFSSLGLSRPEIIHYRTRLRERYARPAHLKTLMLIPQTQSKPFHKSKEFRQMARTLINELEQQGNEVHICFYSAPFGAIPIELDEVYPLSQYETALPPDKETVDYVASVVAEYISNADYETVVLVNDAKNWKRTILNCCSKVCSRRNISFKYFDLEKWSKAMLAEPVKAWPTNLRELT